ncbi:unnamed protein product, partial [Prunus brigantina]
MNGSFLQSTTTPRKACKGIEKPFEAEKRSFLRAQKISVWWSLIGASMLESDQGKWVSLIGIWDREAWW